MDTRKILVGLVVSSISFVALTGTAFASHEPAEKNIFHAEGLKAPVSPEAPGVITGSGEGAQEFTFGPFKISCETAKVGKTKIENAFATTLYAHVSFSHCTTFFKLPSQVLGPYSVRVSPINFEFHQNHFAQIAGENESEVTLESEEPVFAKVASTKCNIAWEAQTIPKAAEKHPEWEWASIGYGNAEVPSTSKLFLPSGMQHVLDVTSVLKGIKTEINEGKCSEFTKEQFNGSYNGSLSVALKSGNLYYEAEP